MGQRKTLYISIYISVYSIPRCLLGVHMHKLQVYFSDKRLPKKESACAHVCVVCVCVCEHAHNPLGLFSVQKFTIKDRERERASKSMCVCMSAPV